MLVAEFRHKANFSGFIYQIQGNIDSFISIDAGTIFMGREESNAPRRAFDYPITGTVAATDSTDKWISFSLLNESYFYITHYELQQRKREAVHFMEQWSFEAYDDKNNNWIKLDTSSQDESFNYLGAQKVFSCKRGVFKHFRIHEEKQKYLVLQRIDVYGVFCQNKEICMKYIFGCATKQKLLFHYFPFIFIILLN